MASIIPPQLVQSIEIAAAEDAAAAAAFLEDVELRGNGAPPSSKLVYPAEFLLGLGSAIRLAAWETAGLYPHLDVGLPTAGDAIRAVIDWCRNVPLAQRTNLILEFSLRVFRVSASCFSWEAPSILEAPALVDMAEDDNIIDAIAAYLWEMRKEQKNAPSE